MASDIYSVLFFHGFMSPAFTEVFNVPPGQVGVIRDMEFYNGTSGTPIFNCQLGVSGSTALFFQSNSLPPASHLQWQGRVVIPSSSGLWLYATDNNVQAVISGYLLGAPSP
jgi:hypothetical protein